MGGDKIIPSAAAIEAVTSRQSDVSRMARAEILTAPPSTVWVGFSVQELSMITRAIKSGSEPLLTPIAATSRAQKAALRRAARRIYEAWASSPRPTKGRHHATD